MNNAVVNVPLIVNAVVVTILVVPLRLWPTASVTVPLTVYVVQVILFKFNVPVGANALVAPVRLLVQVKLNVAKSIVPDVLVNVVQLTALATVVVPEVLLIVSGPIVFPLGVNVPVPTIVAVNAVNVPPLLSVNPFKFKVVVPSTNAVVPKLRVLNQLPVVRVMTAVPLPVNVTFGALVAEPPVVPNVNVLVIEASVVNPPVPETVNPVAVAIDNTVVAAVV